MLAACIMQLSHARASQEDSSQHVLKTYTNQDLKSKASTFEKEVKMFGDETPKHPAPGYIFWAEMGEVQVFGGVSTVGYISSATVGREHEQMHERSPCTIDLIVHRVCGIFAPKIERSPGTLWNPTLVGAHFQSLCPRDRCHSASSALPGNHGQDMLPSNHAGHKNDPNIRRGRRSAAFRSKNCESGLVPRLPGCTWPPSFRLHCLYIMCPRAKIS